MRIIRDVPKQFVNEADVLRALLDRLEIDVANLGRNRPDDPLILLHQLDQAEGLALQLEADGVDVRPERARLESVESGLQRKAGLFVRRVGRARLAQARAERQPDTGDWWWFLDAAVATQRRRTLQRLGLVIAAVLGVLLVGGLVLQKLFPVDPKVMVVIQAQQTAERRLQAGDLAGALAAYDQAAQVAPDSPEVQVWRGVLLDKLGRSSEAAQSFSLARSLLPGESEFRTVRGQAYLALGDLEAALADGQAAVSAQPDLAQAHLLLGDVYEAQGKTRPALTELQRVAELAQAQHQDGLYVLAQSRVGVLLQRLAAEEAGATSEPGGSR